MEHNVGSRLAARVLLYHISSATALLPDLRGFCFQISPDLDLGRIALNFKD